jgi:hypothetical protein
MLVKNKGLAGAIVFYALVVLGACTGSDTASESGNTIVDPGSNDDTGQTSQRITITDQHGKTWDITYAVETYDMDPAHFNFGIGIGAIASVDDPNVLTSSDAGYPDATSSVDIFGVSYGSEHRAYSVSELTRHEVFNEYYEDAAYPHVAAAY